MMKIGGMMKGNLPFMGWFIILGSLAVVTVLAAILTASKPSQCEESVTSYVLIYNQSGVGVRFAKVMIDDQTIWGSPEVIKPWFDSRSSGGAVNLEFHALKKVVQLTLVTLSEQDGTERVSCTLDNRSGSCFFEASYHKGELQCSPCGNWHID